MLFLSWHISLVKLRTNQEIQVQWSFMSRSTSALSPICWKQSLPLWLISQHFYINRIYHLCEYIIVNMT